jgi:serine/threonine protein kinase
MDFGVGRPLAGAALRPAGTPLYMAPEVLLGGKATPRSDLYSVGVLIYHLVTGGYPYRAPSLEALKRAHGGGERTLLREARAGLPEAFVEVVERALQPEPGRRFGGANEMEQALRATVRDGNRRVSWRWIAAPILIVGAALLYPWGQDHSLDSPPPTSTTLPPSAAPSLLPSATPRAERPKNDPFVAPVGGAPASDAVAPGPDVAYSIDARLDSVQLRIRPSAPVSLYVFLLDDAERPSLIFPPRNRMADNPLLPGVESRVPLWGQRVVAVAVPARLLEFEAELARQRVPAVDSTSLPLSDAALARLAAALGFDPSATGRFLAGARPLATHVEMLRGNWIRRLR